MALVLVICTQCGQPFQKERGQLARALKVGPNTYCSQTCTGLARRTNKTKAQKVAEKAAYDVEYRARNAPEIKARKAAYFQATYNPEAAREQRQAGMAKHVEYCRRPEYKTYKSAYDRRYRSKQEFGEYWEAAMMVTDLDNEIRTRITRNEIYAQNGTQNKSLKRKRDFAKTIGSQS